MDTLERQIEAGYLKILGAPKAPFMLSGYGYLGVMLATGDETALLCHECGGRFKNLAMHIRQEHGLNPNQYRDKNGLFRKTSLFSPVLSLLSAQRLKKNPEPREKRIARLKRLHQFYAANGYPHFNKVISMQKRNEKGYCPKQIAKDLTEIAASLGKRIKALSRSEIDNPLAQACQYYHQTWNRAKIFYEKNAVALLNGKRVRLPLTRNQLSQKRRQVVS